MEILIDKVGKCIHKATLDIRYGSMYVNIYIYIYIYVYVMQRKMEDKVNYKGELVIM